MYIKNDYNYIKDCNFKTYLINYISNPQKIKLQTKLVFNAFRILNIDNKLLLAKINIKKFFKQNFIKINFQQTIIKQNINSIVQVIYINISYSTIKILKLK